MSEPSSVPLMIELDQLAEVQAHQDVILVELSTAESYQTGHIEGAHFVSPAQTQLGKPPALGKAPELERLQTLFSHLGLSADKTVVVYDEEGGGWAGRFIWLLDVIGHRRYSYLNGGKVAWRAAGLPLTTALPATEPTNVSIHLNHEPTIELDELMQLVGDNHLAVWDARGPREYSGEQVNAAKGGHIPGAKHYEWTQAMDTHNGLRLRPLDTIRSELEQLGISADKRVVTHCQSHHRSGLTYLIGKLLGFPQIQAYAGSWAEWGNHPDTPVER